MMKSRSSLRRLSFLLSLAALAPQALADDVRDLEEELALTIEDARPSQAGSVQLNGSAIDLRGNIQLSEALSQQAGRDLYRYTQEQGRVTLPATVSGSAQSPAVRIDVGAAATRAMKNKLNEEATKAINRALGNIFK